MSVRHKTSVLHFERTLFAHGSQLGFVAAARSGTAGRMTRKMTFMMMIAIAVRVDEFAED